MSFTQDDYKAMQEEMKKEGSKSSIFWTPKEGKNAIRILPPLKNKGEKVFYFHHRVHFISGVAYESLNQDIIDSTGEFHKARKSAVDIMAQKFWDAGERGSEEWEVAKQLSASDRYIYRIIVRGKDDETLPEMYETGPLIFKMLKNIILDGEYGPIITPFEDGRDFIINREGTGPQTSYKSSMPAANPSSAFKSKEMLAVCLKNASEIDFNSIINLPTEEALKLALEEWMDAKGILDPTRTTISASKPMPQKQAPIPQQKERPTPPAEETEKSMTSDDVDDILAQYM